jgi:trimethylamine--corrinoid protein Co-methyltransferase
MILTSVDGEGLRDLWEMACLVAGGAEEFRLSPQFVIYVEPVSPFMNSKEAVEKLMFGAEKGIPAMYTPCPSCGGTAPATPTGMLVQSLAETLLAVVLCYLKKPGMPLIMGGVTTVLDMLTTTYSYGAPELSLTSAANTDISKWLGLLMFSTGGCTDSKTIDEQAAAECTLSLYNAFLSGANFVHDVGYIDSGLNASLESLVMCDEIIGMIRQIGTGIEVTDETLALDLLREVGPGGEFVSHDHTYEHWKQWWRPKLIDRSDHEVWVQNGEKTMNDRIVAEVDRILAEHEPAPLDPKVHEEMKRICRLADERHS